MAEIKTSLYFDLSAAPAGERAQTPNIFLSASTAPAAGVLVEQSFNFGHAATVWLKTVVSAKFLRQNSHAEKDS